MLKLNSQSPPQRSRSKHQQSWELIGAIAPRKSILIKLPPPPSSPSFYTPPFSFSPYNSLKDSEVTA